MAASVGDVITAETCSSLSIRTGPWPPSQGPSLKPGQQHNTAQVQRLGGTSLASAYRESAWQQKVPLCSSNAVEWQPVHINLQQTWPSQHVQACPMFTSKTKPGIHPYPYLRTLPECSWAELVSAATVAVKGSIPQASSDEHPTHSHSQR